MKYVVFCTKGVEDIVCNELRSKFYNIKILSISDKKIVVETNEPVIYFKKINTIDDVGHFVKEFDGIRPVNLYEQLKKINFKYYFDQINKLRKTNNTFSLTYSQLRQGGVDQKMVEKTFIDYFTEKYNFEYTPFHHQNLDIKIFSDGNSVNISLKIFEDSLYKRRYRIKNRLGSLKPSIAGAMIFSTINNSKQLKIVDNFCGTGTILCEALTQNNVIFGGDIDPEAIYCTKTNLNTIKSNHPFNVKLLNAFSSGWKNSFFDAAISNLPWDKQIKIESITQLYFQTILEYKRIVKTNGMICLLISKPELLIKYINKYYTNPEIKSYKIGILGQTPTIVIWKNNKEN